MSFDVINLDEALERAMGERGFLLELIGDLLSQERDTRLAQMRQAIADNNAKDYYEAAHTIKGAALNLALPALVHEAKVAEFLGRQIHHAEQKGLTEINFAEDAHDRQELESGVGPLVAVAELKSRLPSFIPKIEHEFTRLADWLAAQPPEE